MKQKPIDGPLSEAEGLLVELAAARAELDRCEMLRLAWSTWDKAKGRYNGRLRACLSLGKRLSKR